MQRPLDRRSRSNNTVDLPTPKDSLIGRDECDARAFQGYRSSTITGFARIVMT
jgi:hypothetical protein